MLVTGVHFQTFSAYVWHTFPSAGDRGSHFVRVHCSFIGAYHLRIKEHSCTIRTSDRIATSLYNLSWFVRKQRKFAVLQVLIFDTPSGHLLRSSLQRIMIVWVKKSASDKTTVPEITVLPLCTNVTGEWKRIYSRMRWKMNGANKRSTTVLWILYFSWYSRHFWALMRRLITMNLLYLLMWGLRTHRWASPISDKRGNDLATMAN
jgi:hypothetical protein